VSENRVLRRISGPKKDEIIGYWRTLYSEELNILVTYTSHKILLE
jgi:hypothetical protein